MGDYTANGWTYLDTIISEYHLEALQKDTEGRRIGKVH